MYSGTQDMQIHSIFGTIMKRLLISLSSILICLSAAARNRALLIGIGEYPESSGWEKISAANDMKLLSSTLKREGDLRRNKERICPVYC